MDMKDHSWRAWPPDVRDVVIYFSHTESKRRVGLAYPAADGSWCGSEADQWSRPLEASHWMPLPQPPS